ncbi:MAG: LPS-assembly protein LptD [Verrucomicrobiales bacterium]
MRLISALFFSFSLALFSQQPDPAENDPATIAPVTPVPLPTDMDLLDAEGIEPAKPNSVDLDFTGGADYVKDTETLTSRGPIRAVADTGMTLSANRGRYEGTSKKLIVEGNVKLKTDTQVEVFANHGVLDDDAGTVTLTGDVTIYQSQTLQRGQRMVYNMKTRKIDTSGLRMGVDPILLEADGFTTEERDGEPVFVGRNAGITTHDVENPAVWVRSGETTVFPNDRVEFKNMKIYAGDTPIFWLPYLSQPLDGDLGYHFIPGARSNWGAYLLNSYGIMLGEGKDQWLLSRWNFDLRSKRGLAGGVDLIDRRQEENPSLTGFSLYYANDTDPTLSRTGLPRPQLNEDRWRAMLQYRYDLPFEGGDRWRLDSNLTALSDNYFLEDFDPTAFTTDPNPDNTLGLFRHGDTSLFGLVTRLRPNDFYRSDTRLPEISFDQSRRSIFGLPILHEGQTSFSVVDEEIGSANLNTIHTLLSLPAGSSRVATLLEQLPTYEREIIQRIRALPAGSPAIPSLLTQLLNPGYSRFHTYQELSMQTKPGGWLNFTPEIGAGYSRYDAVNGPYSELSRAIFYAGAEASMKFSRDYGRFRSRQWGLDGLLHVFQPYSRFSYIDTEDLDSLFPVVDRENFTTRPRTLAPNRFTAIDDFRDWNIIRLGMRNRLITRRDQQSYEWLYIDTYMDGYFEDPDELDRRFSNLYNDVTWTPLDWLSLSLETQFPVFDNGSGFSEVSTRLRYMPHENIEIALGHRYLDNHPVVEDSNQIDLSTYFRLNDKWGIGTTHVWELDDNVMEVQQYTLHRDFNHFVGALGFTARDNRLDEEYGVVLSISLKEFPSASLPLSLDAQ